LLIVLNCGAAPRAAAPASQPASAPASQPATQPAPNRAAFQPGVRIDWRAPAVYVDAHVALRSGPLEFFACFPGREHESILLMDATAVHVYQALGLIGVNPGKPPQWNDATQSFAAPTGSLVEVACEWDDAGTLRTVAAADWLLDAEYGRPPLPRPWVFAGSLVRADGALAADGSGAGVALVDFPDVLLAYPRRYGSRNEELWVTANAAAVPPVKTAVTLVLRPARPAAHRFTLETPGVCRVDGRYVTPEDFADLVHLARQLEPDKAVTVTVSGVLEADVAELRALLTSEGLPAQAIRWEGSAITSP
jgi:hypothetical protein